MIVKMTILRLLGSNDDKEKIGIARPEGPPLLHRRQRHRPSDLVWSGDDIFVRGTWRPPSFVEKLLSGTPGPR